MKCLLDVSVEYAVDIIDNRGIVNEDLTIVYIDVMPVKACGSFGIVYILSVSSHIPAAECRLWYEFCQYHKKRTG